MYLILDYYGLNVATRLLHILSAIVSCGCGRSRPSVRALEIHKGANSKALFPLLVLDFLLYQRGDGICVPANRRLCRLAQCHQHHQSIWSEHVHDLHSKILQPIHEA